MSLLLDIAPSDLGLPSKFTSFRQTQAEALDFIMGSSKPFVAGSAPTGIGKSLLGVAAATTLEAKAVYLTATKALQDQIQSDFACIGMRDMRGRANYECRVYTEKLHRRANCDTGNVLGCHYRGLSKCPYFAAYEQAKSARLVSTNYSYWLNARHAHSDALQVPDGEPIGLLICDEAHDALEELARFMAVNLSSNEFEIALPNMTESGLMSESKGQLWQGWARIRQKEINAELTQLRNKYGTIAEAREEEPELFKDLESLKRKLSTILSMDEGWTWERSEQGVNFDPIWPGRYAHLLWSSIPKIILLSATLFPYTLNLLGLSRDDYDYRRFSNGWPQNRAPVYYLPTAKLSYRSSDSDYEQIVKQIDHIIDSRYDRKGIIHTVSYDRMRRLLRHSRHHRIMYYNESSGDSRHTAERFRAAQPPAVLISPSFGTGWDFAYTQCEYQIIPKIPFPYSESRVMKERIQDKDYRNYCAMLEITQMIGRGRRAHDDRCETFILDKAYSILWGTARKFAASAFNAHRISLPLPKKPEKL